MGHKLARLVCSMHVVDNAAQLALLSEKVLEIARAENEEVARAHGTDVSVMLGPAMATIDNVVGCKQRGPQKAAELLNFTMGSRDDSLNAILRMEFNLSLVAEKLEVRLQPFMVIHCLSKRCNAADVQKLGTELERCNMQAAPLTELFKKVNLSQLPGNTPGVDVPLSSAEAIAAFHHPRCLPKFFATWRKQGKKIDNVILKLESQCGDPACLCSSCANSR